MTTGLTADFKIKDMASKMYLENMNNKGKRHVYVKIQFVIDYTKMYKTPCVAEMP